MRPALRNETKNHGSLIKEISDKRPVVMYSVYICINKLEFESSFGANVFEQKNKITYTKPSNKLYI